MDRKFGFGKKTGVQFPGEEHGIVPKLSEYSGATMGNLPMGQGAAVTPMQMVQGYAAIAHGGVERPPQLVKKIGETPVHEPKGHRVISEKTAAEVREMLEGVLGPEGTASEVSVPGYTLAGKTGTAQVAENGGYSKTKYVASFIGFAPAMHPKFLAAIIVDEPEGEIYGGSVAAPEFGEIAASRCPTSGFRRNSGKDSGARGPSGALLFAPSASLGEKGSFSVSVSARLSGGAPGGLPRIGAMRLAELSPLCGRRQARIVGDAASRSRSLAYDSRKAGPGTLFFCVVGEKRDGHEFAAEVVEAGRRLGGRGELDVEVPQVVVPSARAAMAAFAAAFWGDPTGELKWSGSPGRTGRRRRRIWSGRSSRRRGFRPG